MSSTPALEQQLRQNPLFAGLTEAQLSQVMDSMHITQLAEGERLLTAANPHDNFSSSARARLNCI